MNIVVCACGISFMRLPLACGKCAENKIITVLFYVLNKYIYICLQLLRTLLTHTQSLVMVNLLLVEAQVGNILVYVFIGIFVLTALLTLASLPNWIKLDEWYRQKLFIALILEVVGIVVLAAQGFFGVSKGDVYDLPPNRDWIALYEDGDVRQPALTKKGEVDSIVLLGKETLNKTPELHLELDFNSSSKLSMLVKSQNDKVLGKISDYELGEKGLFNLIPDVSSSQNFRHIRWQIDNGKWQRVDTTINRVPYGDFFGKDVRFEVYPVRGGAQYRIFNKVDTVYESTVSDLNVSNRTIHFCKDSENVYYLFRITAADLTGANGRIPFVNLLQIKLEPSVNFRKK